MGVGMLEECATAVLGVVVMNTFCNRHTRAAWLMVC